MEQKGPQKTQTLVLQAGQHLPSTLFYLKKGWILKFEEGSSLRGKKIKLFTNYPTLGYDFEREVYQELKWECNADDCNPCVAFLSLGKAGAFYYYFSEENSNCKLGSGYFIVDPILKTKGNDVLQLDSIRCQTVLAKCLGKFNEWENRLEVSQKCGYNMIHFTPIQELGGSNSSYSLKDQLKLNPAFSSEDSFPTFDDVFELINKIKKEWGVLSMGDVVLNHTANESPWIQSHPECTYNMITSPHLIPAAILDGNLHVLTKEVSLGKFIDRGIPVDVTDENHLQAVKYYLENDLLSRLRLHEFYMVNVDKLSDEFLERAKNTRPTDKAKNREELVILKNSISGRNRAKIDMDLALEIFNIYRNNVTDENRRLQICAEDFRNHLIFLNQNFKREIEEHLEAAVNNCIANMRYFRVQENGPKIKEVSLEHPLVPRYFTGDFETSDSIENEVLGPRGKFVMAHNGWVMNCDPLKNFAESDSNVYLRRELIAWGDSVKLRFGKSREDCPFLWDHMRSYVEISARLFDGLRLDNCHSTPLHVAEYLLDAARKIKPDLYVAAELFTNSDVIDNIFANRLGITAMVRETSTAFNSHELGRLVHRFGGEPVGSFFRRKEDNLRACIAHALFYDTTHDNPSPIEKKNVFYLLPMTALVSMACCATGSTRGIDELVPHHIDVVKEERLYRPWINREIVDEFFVGPNTGIVPVKNVLNKIHDWLDKNGFTQVYVDQMNEDIVAVTRHNPYTHESCVLVAHTAFSSPANINIKTLVKNLKIEAQFFEILLVAKLLNKNKEKPFDPPKKFCRNDKVINGLTEYQVIMKSNVHLNQTDMIREVETRGKNFSEFEFDNFPPGAIIILRFRPLDEVQASLNALTSIAGQCLDSKFDDNLKPKFSHFTLEGLNESLYGCCNEGLEVGMGPYEIPGCGSLVYCGAQGFESVLFDIRANNDLGHPFCDNLRKGPWMLDYIEKILKKASRGQRIGIEELFDHLRRIPKYLLPKYFDIFISSLCYLLEDRAFSLMSPFVRGNSKFLRHLALGSVQCLGRVQSALLPPFSKEDPGTGTTMCAGLPHFSTGYMRSWGRDTFISLRGLLLLTGRFEEARNHILSYATCLRHGLIPNLLDRGVNARYNCRDAVWWWLYAIISYINIVPGGHRILNETVSRMYPTDDSPPLEPGKADQRLQDTMQEALRTHFQGLEFRERNAGPGIDAHMTDKGFNNRIGVNFETGFVFGGNEFNCGTWMDKMGSDSKTGNRGKPATPRDGSAVEIVALCKAVVRELDILSEKEIYSYKGVEKRSGGGVIQWTFKQWEEKIAENFEKLFWIPEICSPWEQKPEMIHRRLIYKDCLGSSQPWADYQLRPNFLIALAVAPEMMNVENAWKSIQIAENVLLGPLGIKTLDPEDWNYNGNYHNDDTSNNPKTAQGFNYHQGPEWLWPVGFLLRAKLIFAKKKGGEELIKAKREIWTYLGNHYHELFDFPWRGLPELTNENGRFCSDGCRVQAWSMASLIEVLELLYRAESDF